MSACYVNVFFSSSSHPQLWTSDTAAEEGEGEGGDGGDDGQTKN